MRGLIGCATVIGAVGFVLGLIGMLFVAEASFQERLLGASLAATMAFIAAFLLAIRDYVRHSTTMITVRRILLAQVDMTETDFVSHFPDIDSSLVGQMRQAMADFFRVPVTKILPKVNFRFVFQCEVFEPGFHTFVVYQILNLRKVNPSSGRIFTFHSSALNDFTNFAKEIQRILDSLAHASEENK